MIYRYLITTDADEHPFVTHWFDSENNFNMESGMIVYDLQELKFTNDGINWQEITEDHL